MNTMTCVGEHEASDILVPADLSPWVGGQPLATNTMAGG